MNLYINISFSIVGEDKIGLAHHLVLRHLAIHPLEHLLATDAIALHDALDAGFERRYHGYHLIDQYVGTALVEYGALHKLEAALAESLEHCGVDDGVDGLGIGGLRSRQ